MGYFKEKWKELRPHLEAHVLILAVSWLLGTAVFGSVAAWITRFIQSFIGEQILPTHFYALLALLITCAMLLAGVLSLTFSVVIGKRAAGQHNVQDSPKAPTGEDKIEITLPKTGEALIDKQPLGPTSFSYMVRGKLRSLPEGHMIWLLTADQRTEQYWPQGFYPVQYDDQTGEWHGRVHPGRSPFRIVALVAPPTSQQLFRYFQKRGDETKLYSPLDGIPAECQNVTSVQTRIA